MKNQKVLNPLVAIAISWGIFLNLAVVLDLEFVHSLAAGGQFETMPAAIRFVYALQTLFLIFQLRMYFKSANGNLVKPRWLFLAFTVIGSLGILMNAFSQSASERINVIPLAISTFGFWLQHKKQQTI